MSRTPVRLSAVKQSEAWEGTKQDGSWLHGPSVYCYAALFHVGQRKKAWLPQHGFGRKGILHQVSKQPWSAQLSSNGEADQVLWEL